MVLYVLSAEAGMSFTIIWSMLALSTSVEIAIIPGDEGDVDWGRYVSALTDIGYDGYTCIEIEDKAFGGSQEKVIDSLKLSKRYMEQFVI